uniref:Uncharacterized protein n=1 Tax=Branchiostoma floridae TaxID=7739 RepID=C3ZE80_BRAFL|eukprot:XP_002593025.1 hypothetical protein BRAFLDRAFT_74344 [Branchiostoma floridae]
MICGKVSGIRPTFRGSTESAKRNEKERKGTKRNEKERKGSKTIEKERKGTKYEANSNKIDGNIRKRFSATTKTEDCFVALVTKQLSEENGEIVDMTIYFLEHGVKVNNTGGAVQGGEEEGAVGGAVGGASEEEQRNGPTLVLPQKWRKSFQRSLENNIHLCHGHLRPALEALRTGCNSYTDGDGKICKFNRSGGDRQLVQGLKIFQSKFSFRLEGKNPHGKSCLCKVHLNGDGSDCYLVYVDQTYKQMGRVFLLVGVFTHSECGIKTGARKKEHGTQRGGNRNIPDATLDMEAAERYLQ